MFPRLQTCVCEAAWCCSHSYCKTQLAIVDYHWRLFSWHALVCEYSDHVLSCRSTYQRMKVTRETHDPVWWVNHNSSCDWWLPNGYNESNCNFQSLCTLGKAWDKPSTQKCFIFTSSASNHKPQLEPGKKKGASIWGLAASLCLCVHFPTLGRTEMIAVVSMVTLCYCFQKQWGGWCVRRGAAEQLTFPQPQLWLCSAVAPATEEHSHSCGWPLVFRGVRPTGHYC